jgi:hypothetical protein
MRQEADGVRCSRRCEGVDMSNRHGEDTVVNEAASAIVERFRAQGRETEAVVVVVLFKTAGDQRDFHIGQTIEADSEAGADELFCECAGRLNIAATAVARGYRSRGKK